MERDKYDYKIDEHGKLIVFDTKTGCRFFRAGGFPFDGLTYYEFEAVEPGGRQKLKGTVEEYLPPWPRQAEGLGFGRSEFSSAAELSEKAGILLEITSVDLPWDSICADNIESIFHQLVTFFNYRSVFYPIHRLELNRDKLATEKYEAILKDFESGEARYPKTTLKIKPKELGETHWKILHSNETDGLYVWD